MIFKRAKFSHENVEKLIFLQTNRFRKEWTRDSIQMENMLVQIQIRKV